MLKSIIFSLLSLLPLLSLAEGKGVDIGIKNGHKAVTKIGTIREFTITENDTNSYTLKLALDDSGRPQYFFRNIFTPVCYTNECKPVHIDFYWDLLGNYIRYEMPKGKILTKVDHDEFEEKDYQKLADILSRSNSIFADLKMEDLLTSGTDSLTDDVDAKTGATLKTIKNDVIDGAVYTCFTLWHIAYGKQVVSEMKRITDTYLTDEMLHKFISSDNYHYRYWAMEKVIDKNGSVKKAFENDIEQVIAGKNLFTARTALQKAGNRFFANATRQNWLWNTYNATSYPMQVAILKRLTDVPIIASLEQKLAASIQESNQEQIRLKLGILTKQKQLSEPTMLMLAKNLEMDNEELASKIFETLEHFQPKNKEVRNKMNQYKSR
ncbi:hypothetical protein [Dyadobacter sp. CY312]|uniref:hypothetical protein n=1 Tax=Dyadobacter sp. CY312 TaxID=2907303 RepID=UPI001F24D0F8|nr:hypothetical protein [Dyadobacter sp. CY312]MCE7040766.1 hypothetical protein [Dyadobacter sp. CY312]